MKLTLSWIVSITLFVLCPMSDADHSLTDAMTLCKNDPSSCDWLQHLRHRNLLDLLTKLSEPPVRNHVAPRFAEYEDRPQYPFGSGWKSQLGRSDKRNNVFSSWGGKRFNLQGLADDAQTHKPAYVNRGGKRTQKFFNWGGKRSVDQYDDQYDDQEHNIMKREIDQPAKMCATDEVNMQELFKEFLEWSRRQPEQKKGTLYRKIMRVNTLRAADNPTRRAGSFYPWGGKRNVKPLLNY